MFPALAEAARPVVPNISRLAAGAHDAGVQVVHCLAVRRPDGRGANTNARLFGAAAKADVTLLQDTESAALIPQLPPHGDDILLTRLHGLAPMSRTDLDPVLRNLGMQTLVVAGASVNVAITKLVMDAVDAGYQVVLPRDAVAGVPDSYVQAVIDNTLALLATVTTTEDVLRCWSAGF